MAGGVLTAKQIAEIRHATIKYRSHKIKYDESQKKATTPASMGTIPKLHTAPIAEGAGSSSSGNIYTPVPQRTHSVPQRTHARPSDGQPTTPFVWPQGPIPVRGQAKRVREEGSIIRTTGQAATDPFVAIVQRERGIPAHAPVYGRNPNRDFRYNSPARSPSPIRAPPGQWVPDVVHSIVRSNDARTAADSLPYADSRAERRLAAAARPSMPPAVVYADRIITSATG